MNPKRRLRNLTLLGLVTGCLAVAPSAFAQNDLPPSMAIVRPAGGFVAAQRKAEVPLMIVVAGIESDAPPVAKAKVTASKGYVTRVKVLDRTRILFFYRPRPTAVSEIFDVALTLNNGDTLAEAFTVEIDPLREPDFDLDVVPNIIAVDSRNDPSVRLNSEDPKVEALVALSNVRNLDVVNPIAAPRRVQGTLTLPQLPPNAPSYVHVVGIAKGVDGYRITPSGVRVQAPVRLSVEAPPNAEVIIEGATERIPPVRGSASGTTVIDDVMVVYGQRVRAFRVQRGRRRPISVVLPTGYAAPLVASIPGQAVADGGTGDTIAVVIPPSPLGGQPFWPDIRVQGARLVDVIRKSPRVRVLVLQRPSKPSTVRVLLDGEEAAAIDFKPTNAQFISVRETGPAGRERGAVMVYLKDLNGAPTDEPRPQVRLAGNRAAPLTLTNLGPGWYRVGIPADTPGGTGEAVEVVVEIPPAPTVIGDVVELVRASIPVRLAGPRPAPPPPPPPTTATASPKVDRSSSAEWKVGMAARAIASTTTAPLVGFGGGLWLEARPPIWRYRLAGRIGAEFVRATGDGSLSIGTNPFGTTMIVAGLRIPLELGLVVIPGDAFELVIRGGGALRIERAALDVEEDRAASGQRATFAGRAGVDAGIGVGVGDINLGFSVVGIGTSLDGVADDADLTGDLLGFRGELGYRIWF